MKRFLMFSVRPRCLSTSEVATDGETLSDGRIHITLKVDGSGWYFEGEGSLHPFGKYYKSEKGEVVAIAPGQTYDVPEDLRRRLHREGVDLIPQKPLSESNHS